MPVYLPFIGVRYFGAVSWGTLPQHVSGAKRAVHVDRVPGFLDLRKPEAGGGKRVRKRVRAESRRQSRRDGPVRVRPVPGRALR